MYFSYSEDTVVFRRVWSREAKIAMELLVLNCMMTVIPETHRVHY